MTSRGGEHMLPAIFISVGVQFPTETKASGGWQRCAEENVAEKGNADLTVNNAEALLNAEGEKICLMKR